MRSSPSRKQLYFSMTPEQLTEKLCRLCALAGTVTDCTVIGDEAVTVPVGAGLSSVVLPEVLCVVSLVLGVLVDGAVGSSGCDAWA